jgi:alpha-N-arabinofuranosidase
VHWAGETFAGGPHTGVRVLDVAATLDAAAKRLAVFVVNRTADKPTEPEISLVTGQFAGPVEGWVVNGPDIKAQNTFDSPKAVTARAFQAPAGGVSMRYTFEPHSVTALVFGVK